MFRNPRIAEHPYKKRVYIDFCPFELFNNFKEQEAIGVYLEEIFLKYARYRRDQLVILQSVIKDEPEWIDQALQKCIRENLYSANDFRDVVSYLKKSGEESVLAIKATKKIPTSKIKIQVVPRSVSTYTSILKGSAQ